MMNIIQGGLAKDHRGEIRFVNDFDMSMVKRFYIIRNADVDLIRGWRAHKIEQRWFYVLSGSFSIDIVKIDDWNDIPRDLPVRKELFKVDDGSILHLTKGYGTAFRALEPDSELLVFSDHRIDHALFDDHTYPIDYFVNRI